MRKIVLLILCCFICGVKGFCEPQTAPALFSVSKDTKVIFSKGNVQYHPKKNIWRFAPNQYDVIGKANSNISTSYNGWVDLFGWGTGNNPCLVSDDYKDYTEFVDWGVNFSSDESQWRTLTGKEWRYLLLDRENASKLLGIGKVAGTLGVFLIPDNGVISVDIEFVSLADQNAVKNGSQYSLNNEIILNKYTTKQWEILESTGVVFLPFTGKRNITTIEQMGASGYYWSSEFEPTSPFRSYEVLISAATLKVQQPISKQIGISVRLVKQQVTK